MAIANMIALLVDGPATVPEIAAESGLCEMTVRSYVRAMRKQRAVHVAQWHHDNAGRQSLAAYLLGRKPDAKRSPPRTRADIARDYRKRQRDARLLGLRA